MKDQSLQLAKPCSGLNSNGMHVLAPQSPCCGHNQQNRFRFWEDDDDDDDDDDVPYAIQCLHHFQHAYVSVDGILDLDFQFQLISSSGKHFVHACNAQTCITQTHTCMDASKT
jgi:hypothetical protein